MTYGQAAPWKHRRDLPKGNELLKQNSFSRFEVIVESFPNKGGAWRTKPSTLVTTPISTEPSFSARLKGEDDDEKTPKQTVRGNHRPNCQPTNSSHPSSNCRHNHYAKRNGLSTGFDWHL